MADEEEDDPVVVEVDVFLAKSLADNLYVFQYPVRPAELSYDNIPHTGAKMKLKQQKVEIELAINTASRNYFEPRGEQIGIDVNGRAPANNERYYESGKMDKQVLVSSRASAESARYAAGVLREGELHITPLQGVLQLRPNFEYMNRAEKNTTPASSTQDEDSQDEEEEAKALTLRFARPESAKAKAQRLSSYKYLEKKEAEEDWKSLQYYKPQHSMASLDRDKLFCTDCNNEAPEMALSPKEYLKRLVPSSTKQESSLPSKMPRNVLSMTQLRTMDLPDQVKALLRNAKVMSFSQLCTLLSPVSKEAAVLKCVQQFGVLVQGCWVVKSEVLHPENSVSPNSGIPSEILCRGRDYIMWRFTQSRVVVRKDIATVTKLPNDDIKEILEQMARIRIRVAQGWEFMLPCDTEFIHKHPEVVKQQSALWENKREMLASQLNLNKIHEKGVDHKKSAGTDSSHGSESKKPSKASKTTANHVVKEQASSDLNGNATETIRSVSPMEIDCKGLTRDVQMDGLPSNAPLSEDSEFFEEAFKKLQDFVCEKLQKTVLSFKVFKKLLLLRQTACEPGDVLCSGVSDALLEDVISSTGAQEIKIKWPTSCLSKDAQSRRFFAFTTIGDSSIDKFREILLEMFQSHHSIKKADFQAKALEITKTEPSKKDWAVLQQELLEKGKHPTYYLRGTSAVLS